MNHDGGPSPMYWVIWSVSQNLQSFPGFLSFSRYNMGFPYCSVTVLYCAVSASKALGTVESVGDLYGDPMLIPSLPSEKAVFRSSNRSELGHEW